MGRSNIAPIVYTLCYMNKKIQNCDIQIVNSKCSAFELNIVIFIIIIYYLLNG